MTWLHPLGLLALAAVPVLIALSLWRWRRREVTVSSLLLWRDVVAPRERAAESRRRQLDPLLLLRVAVALALTAALCGPVWERQARLARRLAVVLDRSASMAMRRPDGSTRWRACRDELLRLLVRLGPDDRVELAAFPQPERAIAPEQSPLEAVSALLRLEPSDAAVEPRELVEAATRALRARPGVPVVVATDAPLPDLPAGASALARGAAPANRGIVAFAARRSGQARHEVLVTVANAAAEPASASVVLLADGRQIGERRVALQPHGREHVIFEVGLAAAMALEAALDGNDALPADDRAWLVRQTEGLRIAWVGDDNYYLRRALAVQSGVTLVESPAPPAEAVPRGCQAAVYYHAVPRALTGGDVVLVAPTGAVGSLRVAGAVEAGPLGEVARRDPLLAAVRLEGVALGRTRAVEPPKQFETLAAAGGVPLIGRWREGTTRLLYVGPDPATGGWALDPSFPVFWANVVAGLEGRETGAGGFGCIRPGVASRVAEGPAETAMLEPGMGRLALPGGVFLPERAGLYRVTAAGRDALLGVSLLSEEETLSAGSAADPPADILGAPGERAGLAASWRLGGWAALAALALVALHAWRAARSQGI